MSEKMTDVELAIGMAKLMKGDTVFCDNCGHEMRLDDPMPAVTLQKTDSVSGVVKTPVFRCENCGEFAARGLGGTMEQTDQ